MIWMEDVEQARREAPRSDEVCGHGREWVVDLGTRRVSARPCQVCEMGAFDASVPRQPPRR
ncbi:MAG: hypothetical protein ACSLFM_04200 [Tepidiformaceae bacterium]